MAQTVTLVSLVTLVVLLAAGLLYRWTSRRRRGPLSVSIRLDRSAPGAHLIWDIVNTGTAPITLTKLSIHPRHGHGALETVPFGAPKRLEPQDEMLIASDVEWGMLAARAIGITDDTGREYQASRRQLAAAQEQLHGLIDRRARTVSAREFLFGAGDLAFGVAVLGLGFFMLMWVIATG